MGLLPCFDDPERSGESRDQPLHHPEAGLGSRHVGRRFPDRVDGTGDRDVARSDNPTTRAAGLDRRRHGGGGDHHSRPSDPAPAWVEAALSNRAEHVHRDRQCHHRRPPEPSGIGHSRPLCVIIDFTGGGVHRVRAHPSPAEPGGQSDVVRDPGRGVEHRGMIPPDRGYPNLMTTITGKRVDGRRDEHRARLEVLRWLGGVAVTGLLYLIRRVPLYRRDRAGLDGSPPDFSRELPGDPDTLQRVSDGVGPLFHRRYWIDLTDTLETPESLIARVGMDLNSFVPREMSRVATGGPEGRALRPGDEMVIEITGPWDGPVRVIDNSPTSFRFATLKGHMEAGEIEFRSYVESRGFLRFEIESWARSGNKTIDILYSRLPLAREAQLYMWAVFCQHVAAKAEGVVMSSVQVQTDRREAP